MSKTGVKVQLQDTTLGTFQPKVGNAMLIYASLGGATSTVPKLITSLDAFNAWQEANDPDGIKGDPNLAAQVEQFYKNAPSGTYLWIYCMDGSSGGDFVTPNKSEIMKAIRYTGEADFDNRPRIIGFLGEQEETTSDSSIVPASTPTIVSGIDSIYDTMFVESFRFTAVFASDIDAKSMLADTATKAPDCSKYNAPACGVVFTSDYLINSKPVKDVGETMGILSAIAVGQSIGSCARPAVASAAYFNNTTNVVSVASCSLTDYDAMGEKQMIFHRVRPGRGIFYNDGATCNDPMQALSKLEYSRLGNAVCDDAEYFFTGILNTQAPVEANGDLSKTYAEQLKNSFYTQYCQPRISQGQCSAINIEIGAQNNDFVGTKTIEVTIKIQPSPNVDQVLVYVMYVKSIA